MDHSRRSVMSRHIQKRLTRNMLTVVLVVINAILTRSLAADEFYVPLTSNSEDTFVGVRIVNASENRVTVAIEALAPWGVVGGTTQLTLMAGESTEWAGMLP